MKSKKMKKMNMIMSMIITQKMMAKKITKISKIKNIQIRSMLMKEREKKKLKRNKKSRNGNFHPK
jgi:hypothetical protein